METDDLYALGVFIVTLFLMTFLQPFGKWISFFGSIGFLVFGLFGIEYMLTVEAAKFNYIHAVVRMPDNRNRHLFIFYKDLDKDVEVFKGIYTTTLILGQPIKLDPYGEFNKVVIMHQYPFEVRMKFEQGKAKYKGFTIKHSQTCDVVLYLRKVIDTDHAEPIPVFWLKDAPGDVRLPPLQYLLPQTPVQSLEKIVEEVARGRS